MSAMCYQSGCELGSFLIRSKSSAWLWPLVAARQQKEKKQSSDFLILHINWVCQCICGKMYVSKLNAVVDRIEAIEADSCEQLRENHLIVRIYLVWSSMSSSYCFNFVNFPSVCRPFSTVLISQMNMLSIWGMLFSQSINNLCFSYQSTPFVQETCENAWNKTVCVCVSCRIITIDSSIFAYKESDKLVHVQISFQRADKSA